MGKAEIQEHTNYLYQSTLVKQNQQDVYVYVYVYMYIYIYNKNIYCNALAHTSEEADKS